MLHKHGKIENRSASGFLSCLRRFENYFWHFEQKQQFWLYLPLVDKSLCLVKLRLEANNMHNINHLKVWWLIVIYSDPWKRKKGCIKLFLCFEVIYSLLQNFDSTSLSWRFKKWHLALRPRNRKVTLKINHVKDILR